MTFENFLLFCAFDQSLDPLLGETSNDWGADSEQHRLKLKKAATVCGHSSASHTPMLGGFVGLSESHPADLQVGFDIEEIDRVSEAAAERVANPKDHGIGDSTPALYWSAREAAFKAYMGDSQPQVMSQIALTEWQLREHDIYQFKFFANGISAGRGYAWNDGEFQFALAFWTPDSQFEKGCRTP